MFDRNPLTDLPPSEVPLEPAPLIRVIAQVRFAPILSIEDRSFVSHFQEAIRETYPLLQTEQAQGIILTPQGFMPSDKLQTIWKFADIDNAWRITLSTDSMAFETTAYDSRTDFLRRMENVLSALSLHINPRVVNRFGLRYIDRIVKQDLEDLSKLVRPEIAGIAATAIGTNLLQQVSESLFSIPDRPEQLLARWGILPPHTTLDPTIESIDERSWVFDLDMSLTRQRSFSVEELINDAKYFAERIYTFFRWAVKDEFLRRFGGEV